MSLAHVLKPMTVLDLPALVEPDDMAVRLLPAP